VASPVSRTVSPETDVSRANETRITAGSDDRVHQTTSAPRLRGELFAPGSYVEAVLPDLDVLLADDVGGTGGGPAVGRWLLATWGVGTLVCFLVTGLGLLSLARLESRAQQVTDQSWYRQIEQLSRELGLGRPVFLLLSRQRVIPMVWGLFRIKLLLPQGATHWDSNRRRLVLLHELAHVKRWDYLTHLLVCLACALHWFNPLVWVAARRMAIERERACDVPHLLAQPPLPWHIRPSWSPD
jgi:beta-lactamase regulating signal transducer with metallopeptidase domain